MKENQYPLKNPSGAILEKVLSKIEKPEDRKIRIIKPHRTSPWIFRLTCFVGILILVPLAVSLVEGTSEHTQIIAGALLPLILSSFFFISFYSIIKKRQKL